MINKNYRNDVSFLAEDEKTLILMEHQSTQCMNIVMRQLIYYIGIIEIYLKDTDKERKQYSNSAVQIPSPEFIVVYNGEKPLRECTYTITANFPEKNEQFIVKSSVYNINYSELSNEQKGRSDSLTGYAFLIDRINYYRQESELELAIEKAVYDCINEGYLLQYLKNRREFVTMATLYLSSEDMQEIRYEDGIRDGIEQGIEQGLEIAILGMLEKGLDCNFISEVLKCDIQKIESIKNNIN